MQGLLQLRQASNLCRTPTNASTFSNTFNTCNAKPTIRSPLFSYFSRHPFNTNVSRTSHHSLPLKARTSFFNTLHLQRSFLCFSSAQLRKYLFNCKVFFFRAHLPNRSFQFTPSIRSSGWRSWFQQLSGYLMKLYLAGATGGSVLHLVHHAFLALSSKGQVMWKDPSRTPALGASGAVNAVMLLMIFLNPKATIYLDFFIPVPAMLVGAFLIGKDILGIIDGNSNISGSAHLGGALVAALAWARIRRGLF